jgi:hypothetical protein
VELTRQLVRLRSGLPRPRILRLRTDFIGQQAHVDIANDRQRQIKGVEFSEDENPAGSQAREVELERSGA